MKLHILGICGTFMGGLAAIARAGGHEVSGADCNVYPPMSTYLQSLGIEIIDGYDARQLQPAPDLIVVGNVLSRGNECVEYMLDHALPFTSGPEWLARECLHGRHVLAVAGTHGKTTTSSMLAWILDYCRKSPGFLIGGIAVNFACPARIGESDCFVIEADEYDTAFFDKRAKFVHYHPRTLVINNLEYDHADIYPDLDAIQRQFHHLIRTVPGSGRIIAPASDQNIDTVMAMGCWSPVERIGYGSTAWTLQDQSGDYSRFDIMHNGEKAGSVKWTLIGCHNAANALAAAVAALAANVTVADACRALSQFLGVNRRLQLLRDSDGIHVYDDFAHHPTAIAATIEAVRAHAGDERIIVVLEPRSNSMRRGVYRDSLAAALAAADRVLLLADGTLRWDPLAALRSLGEKATVHPNVDEIIARLCVEVRASDHILIMSNGGFENIQQRFLSALDDRN